ncbi:MAG TPA: NADH-quinone oxidoreductase subunit N [Bacteroidales bacterium]|nr:NADH-quinone oxidoreductase subunit N [Bacteroidales bacterium]HSA44685.1 NADH-quinone oxidoreductase subunit N [Bacteroidales bacterium]
MRIEDFLLMRHEILLTLVTVILLVLEIFLHDDRKQVIRHWAIVLMTLVTVAGFLSLPEGTLFGGMYQTSQLHQLMKNILNIGALVVFIQGAKWLNLEANRNKVSEFYLLILCTLIGMNFMVSSGDFLMFYLGLELATIPIAAMAAFDKLSNKSSEAGIKLILSSALSSGIMLYGISMVYGTTGSIYFEQVSQLYAGSSLQVLAFIFFFTGMAFKISMVPFHLWTADVYEGAPVNVTSYLSVVSKGAALFIFSIILVTAFRFISPLWQNVIWVISVLTMTIGNLFAIRQNNLKRFLAFSSISQAGFILLGVIAGTQLGMATVVYYVLVYIFSNLGAFGVVAAVSNATGGKENMDDYVGFYRTNPKLALTMMLAMFSLAGIPPVAGFFGKFFLFLAVAEQGYYWLLTIAVLNTIISLYYYLLIVKAMFLTKSEDAIGRFRSDNYTRLGLAICIAGMVIVGFASPIFDYIKSLSFGL